MHDCSRAWSYRHHRNNRCRVHAEYGPKPRLWRRSAESPSLQILKVDAAFKAALKLDEIVGYTPGELSRLRNEYANGGLRHFYEEDLHIQKERAKPGEFDECGEPEEYLRFDKRLKALDCLEEGYRNHTLPVDRLNSDAQFDPLRSEPRFHNLLQRISLPK
jgi:hypothetical protein